jgi:hypothetical protein
VGAGVPVITQIGEDSAKITGHLAGELRRRASRRPKGGQASIEKRQATPWKTM